MKTQNSKSDADGVVVKTTKTWKRHTFTPEQCAKGGRRAREIEEAQGKPLNHGMLFGRKVNP